MGVAVEIEVARSRTAALVAGFACVVGSAGLAVSAFRFATGSTLPFGTQGAASMAAAVACGLGAVVLLGLGLRRRATPGEGLRLVVDEAGEPGLKSGPDGPLRPMALRSSCDLPSLTLLVLTQYPRQAPFRRQRASVTLLLGRDAMPEDAWRRLHVWLHWIDRGRDGRPGAAPDPT